MLAANEPVPLRRSSTDKKLSICLLGYRSDPYSGGQGIYLKFLSKALVDAGHNVDVISGEPYPELDERVRLIKLPGLNLFAADNHVTALRPRHLLSYTDFIEWFSMLTGGFPEPYTFGRRLVQYFEKHQPDYDIVHDNQCLSYGTLQLQKMGVPLITTIHHPITSDLKIALQSAKTWKLRLLVRRWHSFLRMQKQVVKQLKHIVTVSEAAKKDIIEDFKTDPNRITVVHNGIDTEVFRPQPHISVEPKSIMATASADAPLKGLEYLLRAFAALREDQPDIKLNVLGKLKPDGVTAKLIDELRIRDAVTFHSGLDSEEVAALYASATCVVVPSIYEGFGLPAGEAMACQVPVISTDGGALPEVVGDSGITIPTRNPEAIANAVKALFADSDLRNRLAKQGRERIVAQFSWQVSAERMIELYRQITTEEVR